MSSESLDSANQILNAFINRKVTLDNTSALNAQRLVNQFRQISAFKPEFVAEYNKLLLAASDEELMMMKDIVGGPTVRQYLEFLRKTLNESVDENTNTEHLSNSAITGNDGYLPSPDDELPIFTPSVKQSTSNEEDITESSVAHMDLIAQTMKTMQESNQHQTIILNETLNTLKEQLNKEVSGLKETTNTSNISIQDFERWQTSQEQFLQKIIKAQNDTFIRFAKTLSEQLATQMSSVMAKPIEAFKAEKRNYQIETESLIQNTESNNTETTTEYHFENAPIDDNMSVISEAEPDVITESSEPTEYHFENAPIDDNMSVISEAEPDVITESFEPTEYHFENAPIDDNMSVISEAESDVTTESSKPTEYSFENTPSDDNMSVISEDEPDIITESSEPTEYHFENTPSDDDMDVISEDESNVTTESLEPTEYHFENTPSDDDMDVISEAESNVTTESSEPTEYYFENTPSDDNMSVISEDESDVTTESLEPTEYNIEEAATTIDNNVSEMTTESIINEQTDVQFSPDTSDAEIQNINSIPSIPNNIPTFNKEIPLPPPPFGSLPKIPKIFGSIPPIPKGFPRKIASHITDTTDAETDVPATPLNKIDL